MKILVIIVTYNAMQWAERCFNSLRNSSHVPDVFVVDNGSTDGTQDYIQKNYPEVMFYQSRENLGFGKANNIGIQYALDNQYDYIYLLNQDAWIFSDTIEQLINVHAKHPEYGVLSPFQMNADMYHIDRNFIQVACAWTSNKDIINDMYNNNLCDIYPVKSVMAAHWFIPIETIKTVGGFSPSFPHYGEDVNYIERVHYYKYKIGIVPSLKVVHDRSYRVESVEKVIYCCYMESIRLLSSPLTSYLKALGIVVSSNSAMALKFKTIKPLLNMICLFSKAISISRNKRLSMNNKGAFLVMYK